VSDVIVERRKCSEIWHKSETPKDRNNHRETKRNARKSIALAQEWTWKECVSELDKETRTIQTDKS